MTDDARARALAENRRRSEVMAEAQRFGPPSPRPRPESTSDTRTDDDAPPEQQQQPPRHPEG